MIIDATARFSTAVALCVVALVVASCSGGTNAARQRPNAVASYAPGGMTATLVGVPPAAQVDGRYVYFGHAGKSDPFAEGDAMVVVSPRGTSVPLRDGEIVRVRNGEGRITTDEVGSSNTGATVPIAPGARVLRMQTEGRMVGVATRTLTDAQLVDFANALVLDGDTVSAPTSGLSVVALGADRLGLLSPDSTTLNYTGSGQQFRVSVRSGDSSALLPLRWWGATTTTIAGSDGLGVAIDRFGPARRAERAVAAVIDKRWVVSVEGDLDEAEWTKVVAGITKVSPEAWRRATHGLLTTAPAAG